MSHIAMHVQGKPTRQNLYRRQRLQFAMSAKNHKKWSIIDGITPTRQRLQFAMSAKNHKKWSIIDGITPT